MSMCVCVLADVAESPWDKKGQRLVETEFGWTWKILG